MLDLPTARGATLTSAPTGLAISPDGRWLAYVAADSNLDDHLWVRSLDSPTARMIPESERADHPFWSPDSRGIGFFTSGEGAALKKVSVGEGTPVRLCDIEWSRGGAWGKNGDIVFSPGASNALQRISAIGGPATAATALDSTRRETSHRNPSFLPDGWAVEVKSGRGDRTSGIVAFRKRYPRAKAWLVGESGIPLTEFFARPAQDWFR